MFLVSQLYASEPFQHGERTSEEPLVLAAVVLLLQSLLDGLLGLLPLCRLLEGVAGNGALQRLNLESVSGRHQVVVVDDLDERLDLGALGDPVLRHAAGDLRRVALDTGDEGVTEGVRLAAIIDNCEAV